LTRMRRIGFQHERDLARKLWELGFAVVRAPASGSKAKRVKYPDVVAILNRNVYAFEVKTTHKEKTIYIARRQVEKLVEFTKRAGGEGFIAVKIIGEGVWKLVPLTQLVETSSGNYKIEAETLSKALKLRDLLALARGNTRIDDFLKHKTPDTQS